MVLFEPLAQIAKDWVLASVPTDMHRKTQTPLTKGVKGHPLS